MWIFTSQILLLFSFFKSLVAIWNELFSYKPSYKEADFFSFKIIFSSLIPTQVYTQVFFLLWGNGKQYCIFNFGFHMFLASSLTYRSFLTVSTPKLHSCSHCLLRYPDVYHSAHSLHLFFPLIHFFLLKEHGSFSVLFSHKLSISKWFSSALTSK